MYHRLTTTKINKIILCFVEDITATATAKIVGVNKNTVNRYFNIIRKKIFQESIKETRKEVGDFELDESYFGAKRVRGERGDKVFTTVVPNCSKEALMPIIQGHILDGSTINTDGWKAYDGLILNGYDHHRVFHSKDEFARGKCHVNGIENFWSFAKRRLAKFNGCSSDAFVLHLKECEFRYNHRNDDLFKIIKQIFKRC